MCGHMIMELVQYTYDLCTFRWCLWSDLYTCMY